MKILLYTEIEKALRKSGLGKAIKHQMKSLDENGIEYTTNPNEDYDIVHINYYGPKSYLLAKKARKKGKKVIYHAHSTEEDFRNSFIFSNMLAPLFKKWIIKCYTLGDHILTPTPYSKHLLEDYGITVPITDISNGINVSFFKKNQKLADSFREKYGFTKDDKIIMSVGLWIERKGILDFVELAKRMPEYKFVWVGESPLWLSPRKIKKAVKTKLPNLTFTGYLEREDIRNVFLGSDLYIYPTLEETEGIPIMEACASHLPAIIRDIPVFSEWLEDKVSVYKVKDIDGFEAKIKEFFDGKLNDLTDEAYKVALTRDSKVVGKKLVSVYESVLNSDNNK